MKSICLIILLQVTSSLALAWGDLGHQIVGNIAEQRIAPQTKDFVRAILGIEPMAVAANWPDHVRNDDRFSNKDPNFDFSPYHFSEIPTGFTFDTRPNKDPKDAYSAIMGATRVLTTPSMPRENKMIALRYLIHIVGDIQQPLHVGNGFDRGGNNCSIRMSKNSKTSNLHSFWDEEMVVRLGLTYVDHTKPDARVPHYYPDYVSAMKVGASDLFNSTKPVFTASTVSTQVKEWLNTSAQFREEIYPDKLNGNKDAYKLRNYCQWYSDQAKGTLGDTSIKSLKDIPVENTPVLDQTYVDQFTKKIVEPQLIKGGIHLAGLLDYIATVALENDGPGITDSTQNLIIQEIQKDFTQGPL
jgi:hypothetical protein